MLLGTDFTNIGDDFLKLIDDIKFDQGASALKIAHDLKIEHDFLKIDTDFLKISGGFDKLDTEFVKFGDGFTDKITPVGDEGSPSLPAVPRAG